LLIPYTARRETQKEIILEVPLFFRALNNAKFISAKNITNNNPRTIVFGSML
jgi:hypothetical protein